MKIFCLWQEKAQKEDKNLEPCSILIDTKIEVKTTIIDLIDRFKKGQYNFLWIFKQISFEEAIEIEQDKPLRFRN